MAQFFFLPFLSTSSLQQVTLRNCFKLTCLTTNGGFLAPGSLKLFPRFSWVGWCWTRHLGSDGEGTRDCVPLGSWSGLFSFSFIFLLFVGVLCPCDFDKGLWDLQFSSWEQKTNRFVTLFLLVRPWPCLEGTRPVSSTSSPKILLEEKDDNSVRTIIINWTFKNWNDCLWFIEEPFKERHLFT